MVIKDSLNLRNIKKRKIIVVDKDLFDEDYHMEKLETDVDSDFDKGGKDAKKMGDFKQILGSKF